MLHPKQRHKQPQGRKRGDTPQGERKKRMRRRRRRRTRKGTPRRSRDRVKIIARLFKHLNGRQERSRRRRLAARVLLSLVWLHTHARAPWIHRSRLLFIFWCLLSAFVFRCFCLQTRPFLSCKLVCLLRVKGRRPLRLFITADPLLGANCLKRYRGLWVMRTYRECSRRFVDGRKTEISLAWVKSKFILFGVLPLLYSRDIFLFLKKLYYSCGKIGQWWFTK